MRETPRASRTLSATERAAEREMSQHIMGFPTSDVQPLTEDQLPTKPPPQQQYRQRLVDGLKELWFYREVVYTLAWRDIRVRYRQAVLGAGWAILNPLVLMVLFTLVFGRVAGIEPPGGVPYAIYAYVTLVPWALFSGSLSYGSTSVISNASIIRKVYCPREAFPISATLSAGFDFLASSVVLVGMLLAYGYFPRVTWIAALGLFGILFVLALSLTTLVSIITAFYRDTRYGVPILVQILLFLTPVAYPLEKITQGGFSFLLRTLYVYGNPLTPLMDGLRRTILFGQWPQAAPTGMAAGIAVGLLVFTYWIFKRKDSVISDVT